MRRCCVWDKPSSPLSTPPWLWGESEAAQVCTGDGGEEGFAETKTSTAELSHKWQDGSGNTDGYAEPKRAPSLSALGILGMPERDTQIPVTIRGMPVSHRCLIWGLQSSRENKMQLPPSRTCKLFGKKKFFRVSMFSEKKEEINSVFFPSSHLGF